MKKIKPEDKIALENLQQLRSKISEQLTTLLQTNQLALTPRNGVHFFSENTSIAVDNRDFQESRKFQAKLEILMKFSIKADNLSLEFLDLGTRITRQDSKLTNNEIEVLYKDFETAARKYYTALLKINEFLAELINNRLHTTSLIKSPNISKDIDTIKRYVRNLEIQVENFTGYLEAVSIKIIENTLAKQNAQGSMQQADILNLKTAIDQLEQNYINAYDTAFGINGFWRSLKEHFKKSDRAAELHFLKQVSDLPSANDPIRYQALTLVHNKIIETEIFGNTSHLRNILYKLINPGFRGFKTEENDLYTFLDKQDAIQMPGSLKEYYEKHKAEYGCETVAIRTAM